MELTGIDVSVYQGDISWPTVKRNDAIKFTMIKATYGKNGIDPKFTANISGANSVGLPAGAYHYFTAQTPPEAITEANHFANTVKPYKITYPLALSLINEDLIPLGKQRLTENVLAFLEKIRELQYTPILFTNLAFIKNYLDMDKLGDTEIWLAEWGPKPTYAKNVSIWQYTNNGKVYGIDTDVDMNISYIDYSQRETPANNTLTYNKNNSSVRGENMNQINDNFVKNNESNPNMNNSESIVVLPDSEANSSTANETNAAVQNEPNTENGLPNNVTNFYTVGQGESLYDIARKIFGDPQKFKEIMELNGMNNPNVYVGQTIRIPANTLGSIFLYMVKRGDTLWKISEKYLGSGSRYREIMSLNGLTTDMIYPGQILKIPSKD